MEKIKKVFYSVMEGIVSLMGLLIIMCFLVAFPFLIYNNQIAEGLLCVIIVQISGIFKSKK